MQTQQEIKTKADTITKLLNAIGDCIKGATNGVPSGVLYSQLMCFGINLQQYEGIIQSFVNCKLIIQKGNLLYWNNEADKTGKQYF